MTANGYRYIYSINILANVYSWFLTHALAIPIGNWSISVLSNIDMMFFKTFVFCNLLFLFKNLAVAGDRFYEAAGTEATAAGPPTSPRLHVPLHSHRAHQAVCRTNGSGTGSRSVPLTRGSESRMPKNIWIRRIRIRNTGRTFTLSSLSFFFLQDSPLTLQSYLLQLVLRIHDILVWIWKRGFMPLTNDLDPYL